AGGTGARAKSRTTTSTTGPAFPPMLSSVPPVAKPISTVVFHDSMTDRNTPWTLDSGPTCSRSLDASALHIDVHAQNVACGNEADFVRQAQALSDVDVDVLARLDHVAGTDADATPGLECRTSRTNGHLTGYAANFRSHRVLIGRYVDGV